MMTTFNTFTKDITRLCFYAILFLAVVMIGCSDDDDDNGPTEKVKLTTSATLGNYLTDGSGNALYFFTKDVAGNNTCTGGCVAIWPIFYAADLAGSALGEGLSADDFATITVNGQQQTTYKGWPLYYYAPNGQREQPGETKGEAVGNVWFVAKPDYTIMLADAQLVGRDGIEYKGDYTPGKEIVQYFTDSHGRTLYTFIVDAKDKNNFTNGDAAHDAVWPVFAETLNSVPSTIDKNLFGTITVMGQSQITYKGWPVYYYGLDAQRGENKGVSVPSPGVWPVVVKDVEEAPVE